MKNFTYGLLGALLAMVMYVSPVSANPSHVTTSAESGAGLGVYSTGYRMGMVSKFSVKGMFSKTGEGQLLMGREGTPYIIRYKCSDGTCSRRVNPWYFSMSERDSRLMVPYSGEYVWVKYNQAQIKSPMYDTSYLITQIGDIDRQSQVQTCVDPSAANGGKSDGVRVGRIVKISMKGHLSKTGELMMQVGNAGNQFKNMSITNSMFECGVKTLKTAKKVKVHYRESWFHNPFSSDTTYSVWKIEPISDI